MEQEILKLETDLLTILREFYDKNHLVVKQVQIVNRCTEDEGGNILAYYPGVSITIGNLTTWGD